VLGKVYPAIQVNDGLSPAASRGIGKTLGMPVPGTGTFVWWETQIDPTIYFGIPMGDGGRLTVSSAKGISSSLTSRCGWTRPS